MNFTKSISHVIKPKRVKQIMESVDRSEKIVITTHLSPMEMRWEPLLLYFII